MTISFAFKTKNAAYLISETTLSNNIMKIKTTNSDSFKIENNVICVSGNQGDSFRFRALMEERLKYYSSIYEADLNQGMITNVVSEEIYSNLRTRTPYQISAIICTKPSNDNLVSYIDQYGAIQKSPFVVSDYGIYFLYGIFDSFYSKELNNEESMELIKKCINCIKEKIILENQNWQIEILKNEGVEKIKINF